MEGTVDVLLLTKVLEGARLVLGFAVAVDTGRLLAAGGVLVLDVLLLAGASCFVGDLVGDCSQLVLISKSTSNS